MPDLPQITALSPEHPANGHRLATFAAGCFWSVELAFQRLPGVVSTKVGYTGGDAQAPSYEQVKTGTTHHAEAVRVEYDADVVSYGELLALFWKIHNPTTLNRQKNDIGTQYRSAIFYHDDEQQKEALGSKDEQQTHLTNDIVTQIAPAGPYWAAEDYHQRYLEKGGQSADKGCDIPIMCYGI